MATKLFSCQYNKSNIGNYLNFSEVFTYVFSIHNILGF